ncbi:nicastrin [Venturia canescens]|uniref:nicastrin n=1 Tax=Venturia canescens TaxID=32260 RepID=UPI001C9CF217|nr:nicastrin [Venturia canescens]
MARFISVPLLLLFIISISVRAARIKDKIYMSIDDVAVCFRRHNGTHQFGCSSSRSGSVGVIHLIEDANDIKWLEDNGVAGPYTVVLPFSLFTRSILKRLEATNNIHGVLLAKNSSLSIPMEYSPEDSCPNRYGGVKGCDDKEPWNPVGSSLLMEDWPFPMFYLQNETLLEEIKACYFKHNAHDMDKQLERSLCALEMKSFMHAAVSSESCLRRGTHLWNFNPPQFCDPLGDLNIHWPLGPLTDREESVILVIARLDAISMFDGLVPGGNSAVTGLVTLLATAHYMSTLNATIGKTNVLFSLLNGEAFDYIGSGRLTYDLKQGTFNAIGGKSLTLDRIAAVIELGQLGEADKLYLHANNYKGNELIDSLQKSLSLENSTLEGSVPPSSIQSFLATKRNLTAVVISNHGKKFTNKYYHSLLDDARSAGFNGSDPANKLTSTLTNLAIKLGDLLYYNVTGKKSPTTEIKPVQDRVAEMLSCYLVSANCSLFRAAISPGSKLADQVLSLYVGVTRSPNVATSLTGQLLVSLTGIKLPNMTASECSENRFSWMGGSNFTGLCINSTVNYTAAVSPAFIINDYDMKSGQYSTWTESVWSLLSVRMFLKPSPATERLSIILGSTVASLSFLIVWFINSRSDMLFEKRRVAEC